MQMYVNYFDRYERDEHEAPTICSDKNDASMRTLQRAASESDDGEG